MCLNSKKFGNKSIMESAQVAATKGKERRDATQPKHPFKFPQYKSKTVKYVKKCPVIPGSPVEDSMLQDCAEYITKLRELECVSPMNATYDCKKQCEQGTQEGQDFILDLRH